MANRAHAGDTLGGFVGADVHAMFASSGVLVDDAEPLVGPVDTHRTHRREDVRGLDTTLHVREDPGLVREHPAAAIGGGEEVAVVDARAAEGRAGFAGERGSFARGENLRGVRDGVAEARGGAEGCRGDGWSGEGDQAADGGHRQQRRRRRRGSLTANRGGELEPVGEERLLLRVDDGGGDGRGAEAERSLALGRVSEVSDAGGDAGDGHRGDGRGLKRVLVRRLSDNIVGREEPAAGSLPEGGPGHAAGDHSLAAAVAGVLAPVGAGVCVSVRVLGLGQLRLGGSNFVDGVHDGGFRHEVLLLAVPVILDDGIVRFDLDNLFFRRCFRSGFRIRMVNSRPSRRFDHAGGGVHVKGQRLAPAAGEPRRGVHVRDLLLAHRLVLRIHDDLDDVDGGAEAPTAVQVAAVLRDEVVRAGLQTRHRGHGGAPREAVAAGGDERVAFRAAGGIDVGFVPERPGHVSRRGAVAVGRGSDADRGEDAALGPHAVGVDGRFGPDVEACAAVEAVCFTSVD